MPRVGGSARACQLPLAAASYDTVRTGRRSIARAQRSKRMTFANRRLGRLASQVQPQGSPAQPSTAAAVSMPLPAPAPCSDSESLIIPQATLEPPSVSTEYCWGSLQDLPYSSAVPSVYGRRGLLVTGRPQGPTGSRGSIPCC